MCLRSSITINATLKEYWLRLTFSLSISRMTQAYGRSLALSTLDVRVFYLRLNFILSLTVKALTSNDFQYEGSSYQQIWGNALGAAFAPNYANLCVGHWEDTFIHDVQNKKIFPECRSLEKIHSRDKIDVLDLTIHKNKENKLESTIFRKPQSRKIYFYAHSVTTPYTLSGTFLRLKRNCSTDIDFERKANDVRTYTHARQTER